MSAENKLRNITEIRGLACLLLVAYHVVGSPNTGMRVGDGSLYRYAVDSFEFIRMPLFMFLSGLVYAYRPVESGRLAMFLMKKARRLMVPFIVVSTLFFLMQRAIIPSEAGINLPDLLGIYVFPYAHFWYLQALLIIVTLVGLLDAFRLIRGPKAFLALFAGAMAACLTVQFDPNVFAINQAALLLPHFLMGVAVNRFRGLLQSRWTLPLVILGFAASVGFHQASLFHVIGVDYEWNSWVALLSGMGSAVLLLYVMPSSPQLRWIGRGSYTIYLYHPIFTAATRMALNPLGADDFLIFTLSMAAGILGPIAVEALARIRPFTRVALTGQT